MGHATAPGLGLSSENVGVRPAPFAHYSRPKRQIEAQRVSARNDAGSKGINLKFPFVQFDN